LNVLSQTWTTKHYSINEGISNADVRCCFQDFLGFIWIGSNDGLNKFDGIEFKNYQFRIDDSTAISGNLALKIFEDNERNLWILTNRGACIYDRQLDIFRHIKVYTQREGEFIYLTDAAIDKNGEILFVSENGIYKFDKKNR
jgi:ligand-binding sensor domain-containing protein